MPIPYARQCISQEDIQAVVDVLKSDWLTQGPAIEKFEKALTDFCKAGHAVSTCNATSALHLACLALDLKPGDILWTSPITFVASANCARYCGAMVDFVDIDPKTYNLSPELLEEKLVHAAKIGKLPKIVVPVDMGGQPCDLEKIHALSLTYGFKILEDASHAIGAEYAGDRIGSGRYSDVTVFSFHPVKIITTGEGGALLTNNAQIAETLRRLRSHGITRDPSLMTTPSEGGWFYQQIELGFNFRMTDIQAALGFSQMQNIERFVARRQTLADRYREKLAGLPLIPPWQNPKSSSAFHLYPVKLDRTQTRKTRSEAYLALHKAGIKVNVHYIPVHTQPYYKALGFKPGDFPAAEAYYQDALSLPMYYDLEETQQDQVVEALRDFFQVSR